MRTFVLALTALSLAVSGCARDPLADPGRAADRESAGLTAHRVEGGVRLTNRTGRPVAYAVWNTGWLAVFAPCADPGPACVRLAPGASVVVPPAEIGGFAPGMREVVVRWWHVVPVGPGGYRAERVHELLLPFAAS